MSNDVSMTIAPKEIVEKTVNANGQIYLGRDLDGQTVRVAYEIVDEGDADE